MSRTIRGARDNQRNKLRWFNNYFIYIEGNFVYAGKKGWVPLTKEEFIKQSRRFRSDGHLSWSRTHVKLKKTRSSKRRAFERNEISRIYSGEKEFFEDTFEKDTSHWY